MIDGDAKSAAPAKTTTPLAESLERYEKALGELETAPNPSFEQVLEVLIARDVVDKKRVQDQNPSGKSIAKLVELDSRLRAQSKVISQNDTLDEAKKSLNQNSWWWQLTEPAAVLNKAVELYEQALKVLESAEQNPPDTPEARRQVKQLLLARDEVERSRKDEKHPPQETIDLIMDLDDRLWKQAGAIAKWEDEIDKWKVHYNPPQTNWWWQITTESPYFIQCVDRYEKALEELQKELNPTPIQALKLLRARDALEKALKNQPSLPEKVSQRIVDLDQKLKEERLVLAKGKQLSNWKKSLNPPSSNWWWDFKSNLFGDDEVPLSFRDRMWILGALGCLTLATGFVVNTTQTFQSGAGKDKTGESVRSDPTQNALVIFQGAGLLGIGASAATQKGQKMIENLITSIPFIPPRWHAPTTFGLSVIALGVTYGINRSLPSLGQWYFEQGQQLEEDAQFYQAKEKYLQAKKFLTNTADKVKLSLALGELYEQQQDFDSAIAEYKAALGTDDPQIINHLGRSKLFRELSKVDWTGKIKDEAILRNTENYFVLLDQKLDKGMNRSGNKTKNQDDQKNQNNELKKELYINRGILEWSKIDFKKQPFQEQDSEALENARRYFDKATKLEDKLPTTPAGRNARCYQELAGALIDKQKKEALNPLSSYCWKIQNNFSDVNEFNLMASIYNLLVSDQKSSQTSPQPENSENTESNQPDNSTETNKPE